MKFIQLTHNEWAKILHVFAYSMNHPQLYVLYNNKMKQVSSSMRPEIKRLGDRCCTHYIHLNKYRILYVTLLCLTGTQAQKYVGFIDEFDIDFEDMVTPSVVAESIRDLMELHPFGIISTQTREALRTIQSEHLVDFCEALKIFVQEESTP